MPNHYVHIRVKLTFGALYTCTNTVYSNKIGSYRIYYTICVRIAIPSILTKINKIGIVKLEKSWETKNGRRKQVWPVQIKNTSRRHLTSLLSTKLYYCASSFTQLHSHFSFTFFETLSLSLKLTVLPHSLYNLIFTTSSFLSSIQVSES